MSKSKKQQQYIPTCIFCKSTPVTEEHLFPQWMEKEFSKGEDNKHIVNNYEPISYDGSRTKITSKTVNRNIIRLTIKKVCDTCNNGWMSKIETASKEIIKSLILDEAIIIGSEEQDNLVKWGILKTIIGEFADRDSSGKIAISREERMNFFQTNNPSPNFSVYIGRSMAKEYMWKAPVYIHFTAYLNHQNFSLISAPKPNVQWSLFVKDTFILIIFWSAKQCELILPFLVANKLIQIHPSTNNSFNYNSIPTLSKEEMEYIRANLNKHSLATVDA